MLQVALLLLSFSTISVPALSQKRDWSSMCVTGSTVTFIIEYYSVTVLSQKSDWSSIYVLQVTLLLLSLSTISVLVLSQESD